MTARSRRQAHRRQAGLSGAVAGLLVAVALGGCGDATVGPSDGGPPPVTVQAVTVVPTDLPRMRAAVGSLRSPQTTAVAAELAGTVVFLDVPEGRRVEAGRVLLKLDDAQAEAALSIARARHENARRRLRRLESLRAKSVSSEQAFDDATSEFEAARGQLEEAETRLRKTVVRAPFAGALGLRQANVGQYLAPGDPIVEITQIDPLELDFSLPQRWAREVALDQRVLGIVGRCDARFEGRVRAVDPQVEAATRTLRVQALVPNPQGELFAGMAARVRLVVGSLPAAVVVPREAIVRIGTKHVVYVLGSEGEAAQREVVLGDFFVDGIHLRSGVSAGERVVVAGQQKLRPGAPTVVEPYTPTHNPVLEVGRQDGADGCEF